MRNRRQFIRGGGAALLTSTVAGCTDLTNEASPTAESSQNRPNQSDANLQPAEVTWSEEWMKGEKYRVEVTVTFHDSDSVVVKSQNSEVTTLSGSGTTTTTVAGPNTDYGAAKLGDFFSAVAHTNGNTKVLSSHGVGSQEEPSLPLYLNGLQGQTAPKLDGASTTSRTFTQTVDDRKTEIELRIPDVLNRYYSDRLRIPEYGAYVSDRYDDRYVGSIVEQFEAFGKRHSMSDSEVLNHMIGFVQQLEYTRDKAGTGYNEYPKYPVETLYSKEGDCEDTSILLAAMLEKMGYGSVLLAFPNAAHMAVGVTGSAALDGTYYERDGQRYYYLETTSKGWRVGQAPDTVKQNPKAKIYQITAHPSVVFSYAVKADSPGGVKTKVQMRNVGDAAGKVEPVVQFQDTKKNTVAQKAGEPFTLQPRSEQTTMLHLTPPDDRKLRARVGVNVDGQTHDVTTSEWRSPATSV